MWKRIDRPSLDVRITDANTPNTNVHNIAKLRQALDLEDDKCWFRVRRPALKSPFLADFQGLLLAGRRSGADQGEQSEHDGR